MKPPFENTENGIAFKRHRINPTMPREGNYHNKRRGDGTHRVLEKPRTQRTRRLSRKRGDVI